MAINTSENNKRIAKNTVLLYGRMGIMILLSFFTARVTLNALGVEDYGIYNVVAGLVTMFSILSGSLSTATSRFLAVGLGKQDVEELKKTFSTTVNIHLLLVILIVLLLETIGVWFLNTQMNIPPNRMYAANWVLQCSIFNFAICLLNVPYNAAIIAHEKMSVFAFMTLFDASFKLLITIAIYYYGGDKLILLALLWILPVSINQIIYWRYCKAKFSECDYSFVWEKSRFKSIFSFAGWNFIGASSGVLRDQGVNILLNIFCGPAVNAARGITMQINSVIAQFVNNFTTAINPQIIKTFAAGEHDYTFKLVFQGARYSCYLLLLIAIPILIETESILVLWLKLVPDYTVIFVRLILIYTIIEAISFTMITLMLATGNIRNYQLWVGGCQMLNFPLAYLFLKLGFSPTSTYLVAILLALISLGLRLFMLHNMVSLPIIKFLKTVVFNILGVGTLAIILPYIIYLVMDPGILRLIICTSFSLLSTGAAIYFIGCSASERQFILAQIRNKLAHANK